MAFSACNSTKHLKEGQYLLKKNTVKLKTNKGVTRRGELKENLESLVAQKPNTKTILGLFPIKLWLYNLNYEKYERDKDNFQLKSRTVEAPVIFDSTLMDKSVQNFKSYLFNSGYFYPTITDTFTLKNKKAYTTYNIETGINFLINNVFLNVDDSVMKLEVESSMKESLLKKGENFSMSLVDEERSRITTFLKNQGYYHFTQDNIVNVSLDTFNKSLLRDDYNPFEDIINALALQKRDEKNPTLDVTLFIRADNDPDAYKKYYLNRLNVYPDFVSREDVSDSSMITKWHNETRFRYHKYYIREKVLYKNIFLDKGDLYTQKNYDNTINKLNDLGVFQSVRIYQSEDTTRSKDDSGFINTYVLLSPAKKYDFSTNFEISSGTTYDVGSALSFTFRDKNFFKGGNLLNVSLRGGIETNLDQSTGGNFFDQFQLFSRSAGINTSITFPKFIAPFNKAFKDKNIPRTIFSAGANVLQRVSFFTATNITTSFAYNWRQNETNTWDLTPVFISNFGLPYISDSFQRRLDSIQFLKKLYTPVFIEGENIAFTYSNQLIKKGKSYTYARFGLEEAGLLMSAFDAISNNSINYANYYKFDFDLRRYINRQRSQLATRFFGGIGIPYGNSSTLPYIKQYFTGGPYSIRGWRIRTLGPGGYVNLEEDTSLGRFFVDRTGDIKLELNAEYRFDIVQLFYGVVKMKGAIFGDAGNIWLARKTPDFPDGEFRFSKLGKTIAISTGAGLRFDLASFFIFRLDAAFPIKKPYGSNDGWVTQSINFGDKVWRKKNLVFNFAIGYPF